MSLAHNVRPTSHRILLVDDQPTTSHLMGTLLEDAPDLELVVCIHPLEAHALAHKTQPAVILLDLLMPDIDGLTLLQRFRCDRELAQVPILMLTVEENPEVKARAFSLGANDYLIKLPEKVEMIARLRYHAQAFGNWAGREQVEAAIQESEARKQAILETSLDCIITTDGDGRVLEFNPAAEKMFGYPGEEVWGRTVDQLIIPPEHRQAHRQGLKRYLATGHGKMVNRRLETMAQGKTGRMFPVELAITPFQIDGKPFFTSFIRDITDRKQAEEEIQKLNQDLENRVIRRTAQLSRELEERRRAEEERDSLFFLSPNLMCILNSDGSFKRVNPGMEKTLGYPEETLLTLSYLELVHPEDREKTKGEMAKIIEEGHAARDFPLRSLHREGHYLWTEWTAIAKEGCVYAVGRNVTERKRAEEALQDKQRAEAANRAKSAFLATMSHEIRTPLNAIIGMGELMLETRLNDEQKRYLETSNRSGEALMSLINDILDLSKIEAGQLELERKTFNLVELAVGTAEVLSLHAREKNLVLTHHLADKLPRQVVGDPGRIRQILLNLLGNAVKFTQHGTVSLRVDSGSDHFIQFSVTDTGPGIPENKREAIFFPFTQADTSTTREYGGTGLGLTICQQLVDKMGGRIWVESGADDMGSCFKFAVPLPEASPTDGDKPLSERAHMNFQPRLTSVLSERRGNDRRGGDRRGNDRRGKDRRHLDRRQKTLSILLVDDSADNRLLIQAYFIKTAHQLEMAENGAEALEKFQVGRYDMVLMDVQMPIMDGITATRKIRQWEKKEGRPHTPVIALTAHALKEISEEALAAGCDYYLAKPIKKAVLMDTVYQLAGHDGG
ncbi:MAG: PAS domain S-box protein [Magnetococcales bacterium]|nr:PAS domain S-box protein [Magnetococcales bacterium]